MLVPVILVAGRGQRANRVNPRHVNPKVPRKGACAAPANWATCACAGKANPGGTWRRLMRLGYFTMPVHPMHRTWAETLKEDREAVILADQLDFHDAFI